MPGFMEGMDELFKNNLFLQYLSSGGAALGRGENISAGLNPVTQQSITAQAFAKMLKGLLGQSEEEAPPVEGTSNMTPEQMSVVKRAFSGDNTDKLTVDGTKMTYTSELGSVAPGQVGTSGKANEPYYSPKPGINNPFR